MIEEDDRSFGKEHPNSSNDFNVMEELLDDVSAFLCAREPRLSDSLEIGRDRVSDLGKMHVFALGYIPQISPPAIIESFKKKASESDLKDPA